MLFDVRGDGLAIDLLEDALERGGVHQILARKLLNRHALGKIGRQLVVDVPDDGLLRRLKIDGALRTRDLHHLLHDLVQHPDLRRISGLVIDLLAVAAADEQSALRQRAEMVRHGGAGHLEQRRQIDDALLPVAQQPEDAHARRVAELLEDLRNCRKMRHIHQLAGQIFNVAALAVVVRQRESCHMVSLLCPFWKFPSPFRKHPPPKT